MTSTSDALRLEKKVDALLELVQGIVGHLAQHDGMLPPVVSPLSWHQQYCPLCQKQILFTTDATGETSRQCGCRLPTTGG